MSKEKQPKFVTIAEFPNRELYEGSGIFEEDGRELTNLAALQMIAEAMGSVVITSANGSLSPEAKKRNGELTRNRDINPNKKGPEYIVAVRLQKEPK